MNLVTVGIFIHIHIQYVFDNPGMLTQFKKRWSTAKSKVLSIIKEPSLTTQRSWSWSLNNMDEAKKALVDWPIMNC